MKIVLLAASTLLATVATTAECLPRRSSAVASYREAGAVAGVVPVALDAAAVASTAATEAPESRPLDRPARGPAPWQKDRATIDRERALLLGSPIAPDLDR